MPTVFTHAVVALGLGRVVHRRQPARFWLLTAACAMLPDLDALAFRLGIPYASVWGHRGFTHSLPFAAAAGLAVALLFGGRVPGAQRIKLAAWFAGATASHGLLDALTDGGLGVAFFAPFEAARHFFPWRPVRVSPIGAGFFSARGAVTLFSELRWLVLPALALVVAGELGRRFGRKATAPAQR